MRSKIVVMGFVVLAGAVARDHRASACAITDMDTDPTDLNFFMCQGGLNPLPDPISGIMDPRPSIFFAPFGRPLTPIPPGCNSPLLFLDPIPTPDCTKIACPNPASINNTGLRQWSFFVQDDARWHLDDNEWDSNGKSDTVFYNPNQPYSKILSAAYLVWFGIKDSGTIFHGTQDYVELSQAGDSSYHDSYFRSVTGDSFNGQFDHHFVGDDEIKTTCQLYSAVGKGNNNIVFRAGVVLHESWHGWENFWMNIGGTLHANGPVGSCMVTATDFCDNFFPHTIEDFRPFGTLHEGVAVTSPCPLPNPLCVRSVDKTRFHSPNQVAWEFGCDLITSPADWVTMDIQNLAQLSQANFLSRFINGAPMQCMNNSPMMGP